MGEEISGIASIPLLLPASIRFLPASIPFSERNSQRSLESLSVSFSLGRENQVGRTEIRTRGNCNFLINE
jgi:hypothetical protein